MKIEDKNALKYVMDINAISRNWGYHMQLACGAINKNYDINIVTQLTIHNLFCCGLL